MNLATLQKYALSLMAVATITSCRSTLAASANMNSARDAYPPHWWTPVPKEGAPAWEVLPQEAGPGEVILSKRNELGILSNFAPTPFVFRGQKFGSLEGLWQSTKFPENSDDPRATYPGIKWTHTRAEVEQMTAFEAKHAGDEGSVNMKLMKIDWVSFQGSRYVYKAPGDSPYYQLIRAAMWEKLQQNPEVKRILLLTGDLKLRPDHQPSPPELKAWAYYQIWMDFRSELQKP